MNPIKESTPCPCGTGKTYGVCCGPFHDGKVNPETPEKLMRSRYSAYVAGKIDYIDETNDPTSSEGFDREAAEVWSQKSEWKGLEIVAAKDNQVEFKAHYVADNTDVIHHEVSLFRFDTPKKKWFYQDGRTVQAPITRAEPKLGRNDPCACGSGKKFKKCCG